MDLNVLHHISYGMFVVSSNKGSSFNGQIANTVFQVTAEPAAVAISINKQNLTHEHIEASRQFSVSILNEEAPLNFIGKFGFKSGRSTDKFKGTAFKVLDNGLPVVLDYTIGYLSAKVVNKFDCGTHTLFLGEIISGVLIKSGKPLTYSFYHQVKRGSTPQSAPTFTPPLQNIQNTKSEFNEGAGFIKYRCVICNYIYDPATGDPDGGIAPGTPFEKIPNNWVCPVCGADKSQFVPEE